MGSSTVLVDNRGRLALASLEDPLVKVTVNSLLASRALSLNYFKFRIAVNVFGQHICSEFDRFVPISVFAKCVSGPHVFCNKLYGTTACARLEREGN